jgi:heme/copper-type cytochrome/quinol oxidase subunit 2
MNHAKALRKVLLTFTSGAVVLPIVAVTLAGVAYLLQRLGDAHGAQHVVRAAAFLGGLWLADVVLLVIALAVHALGQDDSKTP